MLLRNFLKRENTIIDLKDEAIKEYGGIKFQEIAFAQKINIRGDSHNKEFMSFYGNSNPSWIEFIINKNSIYTKVFDNLEWYTESNDNKFEVGTFSNSIDNVVINLEEVTVKELITKL